MKPTTRQFLFLGSVLALGGCASGSNHSDAGLLADGGRGPTAPTLTSATAQVSGRTGLDLSVSIKGTDPDHNIVSLWVRLLDSRDSPVVGFDTNRDGVLDSAEGAVSLDTTIRDGGASLSGDVLTATGKLPRLFETVHGVAKVGVCLQDSTNLRSDEQLATLRDQPVMALGQACDPLYQSTRCQTGLGCRGTPATCQEGLPPTITQLAFYQGATSPTILIQGTEPEDDLATIHFTFQNASGQAISIDSDGDGTPDLASFDYDATGAAVDGAFFIRLQAGDGLDQQVPKLVATGTDKAGHTGTAKTALPTAMPLKTTGQTCDPRGFDTCGPTLACSPGTVGATNVCKLATTLRAPRCTAAPVLVPTSAGATVLGVASGVSLWDAPPGCSSNDPTGRPEGVVTLRLTQAASTLTLTTARPGTNFDTTLYLLPGCPNDSLSALGWNDDLPNSGGASQLVLSNVPAGDYAVVVDSFDFTGGAFELMATAE